MGGHMLIGCWVRQPWNFQLDALAKGKVRTVSSASTAALPLAAARARPLRGATCPLDNHNLDRGVRSGEGDDGRPAQTSLRDSSLDAPPRAGDQRAARGWHVAGLISEADFEAKKQALLNRV